MTSSREVRRISVASLFPPIKAPLTGSAHSEDGRSKNRTSELIILPTIQHSRESEESIDRQHSVFDPEDDYDYDQDEDQPKSYWKSVPRDLKQTDLIKGYYRRACERENVLPSARFLDQIGCGHIIMKDVGLSRKALKAMCACSVHMDTLRGLDLSGNMLGASAISYLTQLLKENKEITYLILADNNVNGRALQILSEHLASTKSRQFYKLDLSGNNISDDDGHHLAKIIQKNTNLQELYLGNNKLRENGPILIANALAANDSLDVLNLSWNHIRGTGAVALSNSINKNTNLKTLNVSWNGFGYEGSLSMGQALVHNSSLIELDLSNNRIHPPALFNFMDDMLKNNTLLTLKLAYNPIPVCYTSPLLTLIVRHKHIALNFLDLSGVVVDSQFESLLTDLQSDRDFTMLYERSLPIHKNKWAQMLAECEKEEVKVLNIDPVRILYLLKQNLRCIDMLVQMDKDNSYDLSRNEIKEALDRQGLPVSSSALDMIMKYLDTNKDGRVDLNELIDGDRRITRDRLHREEAERQQDVPSVDTTQYSRTFKGNMIKGLHDAVGQVIGKTNETPSSDTNNINSLEEK